MYEKYKHLDHLLSDLDWLPEGLCGQILFDLWSEVRGKALRELLAQRAPVGEPDVGMSAEIDNGTT